MMNGVGENQFAPNAPLTREMLAVVLYNMEKQPESTGVNPFADVKADMWYTDAIVWANANGIVNGMTATTLAPQGTATRAQVATMLMNFCENVVTKAE